MASVTENVELINFLSNVTRFNKLLVCPHVSDQVLLLFMYTKMFGKLQESEPVEDELKLTRERQKLVKTPRL